LRFHRSGKRNRLEGEPIELPDRQNTRGISKHFAKEKAMKSVLRMFVIMAALSSTSNPAPGSIAQSAESNSGVQVIEVTAKEYEFTPSPIRVKQVSRSSDIRKDNMPPIVQASSVQAS
jgi:hypothetical protein